MSGSGEAAGGQRLWFPLDGGAPLDLWALGRAHRAAAGAHRSDVVARRFLGHSLVASLAVLAVAWVLVAVLAQPSQRADFPRFLLYALLVAGPVTAGCLVRYVVLEVRRAALPQGPGLLGHEGGRLARAWLAWVGPATLLPAAVVVAGRAGQPWAAESTVMALGWFTPLLAAAFGLTVGTALRAIQARARRGLPAGSPALLAREGEPGRS